MFDDAEELPSVRRVRISLSTTLVSIFSLVAYKKVGGGQSQS